MEIPYVTGTSTGCDPEIFLTDAAGQLVPAWRVLQHREQNKTLYYDGFAAEFTPHAPACHQELAFHVWEKLKELWGIAKQHGLKLSPQNTFEVSPELMATGEEWHVQLGCSRSFNAYGLEADFDRPARELLTRSAGGHVHIGFEHGGFSPAQKTEAVKFMDAFIGIMAVGLAQNFDKPERRRHYGLPGEFRTPRWGLEYRTLSNFWLIHPRLSQLVFDCTRASLRCGLAGLRPAFGVREEEVVDIIRNCDVRGAQRLMWETPAYMSLLKQLYGRRNANAAGEVFSACIQGLESWVPADDIAANWRLDKEFANVYTFTADNHVNVAKFVHGAGMPELPGSRQPTESAGERPTTTAGVAVPTVSR